MTIETLVKLVATYNIEAVEKVREAYRYASLKHRGQVRQSGEEYIAHPLAVAYILAEMHADSDTLCAALLHDTLEDTDATKEEIAALFNATVASLVDGVTKLGQMNFSGKTAQNMANTRKLITGITEDVRIVIIKLADRLHNMRTLQFKSEWKQKENALETIEIFVPLAYYIGAYRIKSELEDLALQYLKPDTYRTIRDSVRCLEDDSQERLKEMLVTIQGLLNAEQIPNDLKIRTKNIYGVYKRLVQKERLNDIHDLFTLKIMVDSINHCYQTLRIVHDPYKPINDIKDYICNPKTNLYQSLHTTVFGPENRLVQAQIRTFDMDKIASFGLTAYWDICKGQAGNVMQEDLKRRFQFFKSLITINDTIGDNQEFVTQVKKELFSDIVYVYTTKGEIIELPAGATPIDFAYKIHTDVGNTMVGAVVNDHSVSFRYALQDKDRVRIITSPLAPGPTLDWLDMTVTTTAKRKIREFSKKKSVEKQLRL